MTPDMKRLCEAFADPELDQFGTLQDEGREAIVRAVLTKLLEGDDDEDMINRIDRILAEPATA